MKKENTPTEYLTTIPKITEIKGDLKKIEIFLRRLPFKKFYEENEITHLDYIKYHTEVFCHKINTLLELFKLMINEIYELGYSEEECKWKNLLKSNVLKESFSMKVIEDYRMSFEHIIQARHLNTHRGIYVDSEKDEIEIPMMIYKNSEKLNLELDDDFEREVPKFYLEFRQKEYKNKRRLYIKNSNNVAEQYINMFMNTVLPEFLKEHQIKSRAIRIFITDITLLNCPFGLRKQCLLFSREEAITTQTITSRSSCLSVITFGAACGGVANFKNASAG